MTFLLSVSIHGEARDFSLPIHKSYLYLKGNILRATGALAAGMIGIYVVQSMVMVILMGMLFSGSKIGMYFAFFVMFAISSLVNFLWVGFGARYAIRVVPDLRI